MKLLFNLFFGLTFVSLLVSCSKMDPIIQQKDKIVDHSTYDALTASEDFSKLNDKQLREVVANVRTKRTQNFDWSSFWYSVSKKSSLSMNDNQTIIDIFSLASISCQESPVSGFTILVIAKEGIESQIRINGASSLQWLEQFNKVANDCHLESDNQFLITYTQLFQRILIHGSKELRLYALNDLNDKIERKASSPLVKEIRELLYKVGDNKLLGDGELSFDDQMVMARTFGNLFPYRENIYLKDLLSQSNLNHIKKNPDLINDLNKTGLILLSLDVTQEQLKGLNSLLIQSWLQTSNIKSSDEEEVTNAFIQKFEQAELLLSLQEKELLAAKNKQEVLNNLELIIRHLEKSFFQLERPESFITKSANSALILFLDLRLSKKTGLSLLKEAQKVKDVSNLSDVLKLFHRMYSFRNEKRGHDLVSTFCAWSPSKKIQRFEQVANLINGCNYLTENTPNNRIKIKGIDFNMPLFSILNAYGQTLVIDSKRADFSVFDLSQIQRSESLTPVTNNEHDAIAFPLIIGFELNETFLNFQKDKVYYFPLNYVFKKASAGPSHIESSSQAGSQGGNLILKMDQELAHSNPVLFSSGGQPAAALDGIEGGKGVKYLFDLLSLEEWILSSTQGEFVTLESLSAKNLKKLFSLMKKNGNNDILVKIDPEFLLHVGQESKLAFDHSLSLVREKNLYQDSKFLESLTLDGLRSLQSEIDHRIQNGDSFSKLSILSSLLDLPQGHQGPAQQIGAEGIKGGIVYE